MNCFLLNVNGYIKQKVSSACSFRVPYKHLFMSDLLPACSLGKKWWVPEILESLHPHETQSQGTLDPGFKSAQFWPLYWQLDSLTYPTSFLTTVLTYVFFTLATIMLTDTPDIEGQILNVYCFYTLFIRTPCF